MSGGKELDVKERLMKLFERVAEEMAKNKKDTVAIFVRWKNGVPEDIDFEFDVGVCECGEWATRCEDCYYYNYDVGYEEGYRKGREECDCY